MNRRTVLKAGLVLAASSHTAVATAETSALAHISIDDFLIKATPAERASYHANALGEAMNDIRPGHYAVRIDHDVRVAVIFDTLTETGVPLVAIDGRGKEVAI